MKLIITNVSGISIYEQIKEQIKAAILSEDLKEGEMLPSLRKVAKELKISVLTTTRAYTELEREGFVKNVQGKGCYVMSRGIELIHKQRRMDVEKHLKEAIESAQMADMKQAELHELLDRLMEANKNG